MLKNDYILQMIVELGTTIRKVLGLPAINRRDHYGSIEEAVGEAVGIDPSLFFSLEPESAATLMNMGDVDKKLATYVSHAILLMSRMMEADGDMSRAQLRREQAFAIASAFEVDLPDSNAPIEEIANVFPE